MGVSVGGGHWDSAWRTGGGSVREEGRAAPLRARAQTAAALRCFEPQKKKKSAARARALTRRRKRRQLFCVCIDFPSSVPPPSLGTMSACRAGLVLLCAVLAVTRARRSSPEQEDAQEKMNSARCTSRCLTLHMTQLTATFRHIQVLTTSVSLI